jgi:hypothetical protein
MRRERDAPARTRPGRSGVWAAPDPARRLLCDLPCETVEQFVVPTDEHDGIHFLIADAIGSSPARCQPPLSEAGRRKSCFRRP